MAIINFRVPDWLKERAKLASGNNLSRYIKGLIIKDTISRPIKKIPHIKSVKTGGGVAE